MRSMLFCAAALLAVGLEVRADGWGTVKGKVILDEEKIKEADVLKVDKDQTHCLAKGDLTSEKYVVDPKSKGVRWVMVWLVAAEGAEANHAKDLPIHDSLKKIEQKEVVIDQPMCRFEPHMVGVRIGQDLVGKNSAPIPHNLLFQGKNGVNENPLIPSGGKYVVPAAKLKPHYLPTSLSCSIHSWMNARMFVFKHPYFCITDKDGNFEIKNAPAGDFRLMVWHEGVGFVHDGNDKNGQAITIKDGGTTEVPTLKIKYSKD